MSRLIEAEALDEQPASARPTVPAPADKTCGCGATHDVFEWLQLRRVGVQECSYAPLELRDCACLSTIAVALCSEPGCLERSVFVTDDERSLCAQHERAWHVAEVYAAGADRRDFADECRRESIRDLELDELEFAS